MSAHPAMFTHSNMFANPPIFVHPFPPQPLPWDMDPDMLGMVTILQAPGPFLTDLPPALPRRVAQLRSDQPGSSDSPQRSPRPVPFPPSPLCRTVDSSEAAEVPFIEAKDVKHDGGPQHHQQQKQESRSPESPTSASLPITPEFDFVAPLKEEWASFARQEGNHFPYPLDDPRYVPLVPDEHSSFDEKEMYLRWAAKTITQSLDIDHLENLDPDWIDSTSGYARSHRQVQDPPHDQHVGAEIPEPLIFSHESLQLASGSSAMSGTSDPLRHGGESSSNG